VYSVLRQMMKNRMVDPRHAAPRSSQAGFGCRPVPVEKQLLQSRPCVLKMLVHRGASATGTASRTATVRRGTGDSPPSGSRGATKEAVCAIKRARGVATRCGRAVRGKGDETHPCSERDWSSVRSAVSEFTRAAYVTQRRLRGVSRGRKAREVLTGGGQSVRTERGLRKYRLGLRVKRDLQLRGELGWCPRHRHRVPLVALHVAGLRISCSKSAENLGQAARTHVARWPTDSTRSTSPTACARVQQYSTRSAAEASGSNSRAVVPEDAEADVRNATRRARQQCAR
jgi:hypothetical protein